jgi:hypothetical protein
MKVHSHPFLICQKKEGDKTMKSKKFGKKLVLKKRTIVHLGTGEMKRAQGGATIGCTTRPDCSLWLVCVTLPGPLTCGP